MILICYRMLIQLFVRELWTFVVSLSLSTPPSLQVPHTSIFRPNPSCPYSRPYQPPSARRSMKSLRCTQGSCFHGQRFHWNGLDTRAVSIVSAIPPMDGTSSPDPQTKPFGPGMPRLALWLVSLWRGTPQAFRPLLTLLMDGISSPDPKTTRFDSGMPRLALWLVSLWRGTLTA